MSWRINLELPRICAPWRLRIDEMLRRFASVSTRCRRRGPHAAIAIVVLTAIALLSGSANAAEVRIVGTTTADATLAKDVMRHMMLFAEADLGCTDVQLIEPMILPDYKPARVEAEGSAKTTYERWTITLWTEGEFPGGAVARVFRGDDVAGSVSISVGENSKCTGDCRPFSLTFRRLAAHMRRAAAAPIIGARSRLA